MKYTRSQIRAAERKGRRGDAWAALAAIVLGLAVAWIILSVQTLQQDLRTSNEARDALARQVQSLGQKPVAGPPGSRGEPGQTKVGARGPSGPPGPSGSPGKPAPTITPSPGPPGPAGPSGAPGADSTVPGPAGPSGAAGQDATGAPGQDGQDGQDGSDGSDGADGQDGAPPSEWTYVDQDGNEYKCVPVDDFDPDNPRYRCTQTSTTDPDPEPEPSQNPGQDQQPSPSDSQSGLLPVGLLNDRRRS